MPTPRARVRRVRRHVHGSLRPLAPGHVLGALSVPTPDPAAPRHLHQDGGRASKLEGRPPRLPRSRVAGNQRPRPRSRWVDVPGVRRRSRTGCPVGCPSPHRCRRLDGTGVGERSREPGDPVHGLPRTEALGWFMGGTEGVPRAPSRTRAGTPQGRLRARPGGKGRRIDPLEPGEQGTTQRPGASAQSRKARRLGLTMGVRPQRSGAPPPILRGADLSRPPRSD
jgi:hypothetical protein